MPQRFQPITSQIIYMFRVLIRKILALSALIFSAAVFAYPAVTGTRWGDGNNGNFIYPTAQAACDAYVPGTIAEPGREGTALCIEPGFGNRKGVYRSDPMPICGSNATLSGNQCTCNTAYIEEAGQCVESMSSEKACGAAFYNSNAFGNTSLPVVLDGQLNSGSYCQPQGDSIKPGLACAMNFELEVSWKTDDGNWHSRGRLQPKMIGTNFQPCVPGLDPTTNPPDPEKPPELPKKQDSTCPNGYQGQVGAETKCIPSYGYNGVNFAPTTKYDEDSKTRTETTTKTECASGKCTTTDTVKVTDKATGQSTTTSSSTTEVDRAWCAKPENKDKCAANGKPAYSGQETGASSGGGGNGDGDDKGGRCGAKGQPPCKIDETGTPDGEGKFDSALDKLERDHQQRMDILSGIKNTADKDTSMGTNGGFQWLTHKACSPWNLGELRVLTETFKIEINICVIEPYIVPVMNFLWIFATIWMTFARVASVMGAKVD